MADLPLGKRSVEGWNFSPDVLGYECNSNGDIKESKTHTAAVTNVADKGCSCQKGQQTIMRSLRKVSSEQTSQLTLKFQLAH